jgi:transcription elongation factor SPT6
MLTITWAFQDNWFKHIDVEELDKKEGSLGLSNKLVIREKDMEGEIFSDLDEIYARYIEPMNDFVSSMVSNKCFHTGSPTEVEATLEQDSIKNPNRIPYFIRFEPGFPGVFILTWYIQASTNKVKTLKIVVRPQGYRVLEETFTRPSELIAWFKEKAAKANERLNNKPLSVAQQIHKTLASVTQQQTQSQSNMAPQRRSNLFRSNVSTPAAMAFQHQPSMPIHPGPYIHQPSTPYGYQPPAPYLYQQQTQYQQPYMTPGRGPVGSSFQQPQYPPINYPPQQLPPRSYPRQNY